MLGRFGGIRGDQEFSAKQAIFWAAKRPRPRSRSSSRGLFSLAGLSAMRGVGTGWSRRTLELATRRSEGYW